MTLPEYESRSYEDLSKEFKEKASRAVELVPLMYNRLTLVDKLSHIQAIKKIYNDHGQVQGFSPRNIRRYFPVDNPTIPRRVRTEWPKSIPTHNTLAGKLSNVELQDEINRRQSQNSEDENPSMNYNKLSNQNAESIEVIPEQTTIVTANKTLRGPTFRIPKEKYEMLRVAMSDSNEFICLIFNWRFEFDHLTL